eukprot:Selendium_serpulae@DN4781_c0_g1_i4.p1
MRRSTNIIFAALWGFLAVSRAQEVDEINCADFEFPHESFAQPDVDKVYLAVDKVQGGPFKNVGLTKYTTVFGVRVIAHKSVPDEKVLHTANLLAQMMDNDQDGKVDRPNVQQQLIDRFASMIIVADETFTNYLLSETEGEGLPKELKFCPFSIDFEEMSKIQPGESPEATCPEDLFEKDRSLAFVTDHLIGRSWPMYLADKMEEAEASEDYKKLEGMYKKAVADKNFDVGKTGCPEADVDRCGLVMFASWSASTALGMDRCYCEAVGAWKLCDGAAAEEKYPELVKFMKLKLAKHGLPNGLYKPKDESVVIMENIDHDE